MGVKILLTGATGGIGERVAARLYESGADIIVSGSDLEKLNAIVERCSGAKMDGGHIFGIRADLRDVPETKEMFLEAIKRFGGSLDVLINNAGLAYHAPIGELDEKQIKEVFEVNVIGPMMLCSTAFQIMRRRGSGRIVNVTSILAEKAMEFTSVYTASKHALSGFSDVLKLEASRHGISVVEVRFGAVGTAFLRRTCNETAVAYFNERRLRPLEPDMAAKWIVRVALEEPGVSPDVVSVMPLGQVL